MEPETPSTSENGAPPPEASEPPPEQAAAPGSEPSPPHEAVFAPTDVLETAPPEFRWGRFGTTEKFLEQQVEKFLAAHPFARQLSERMRDETSTLFFHWIDHFVLPKKSVVMSHMEFDYGFHAEQVEGHESDIVLWHPHAHFPRVVLSEGATQIQIALKVDSIEEFLMANQVNVPIEGAVFSGYRVARMEQNGATLLAVERRGYRGYLPQEHSDPVLYMSAHEAWATRPRLCQDDAAGMEMTLQLAATLASELGPDLAAHIAFDCERSYWQKRNTTGALQKLRQDHLGLGWANHDHHTFRSSRAHFPALMKIFRTFGFKMRERYYAGAEAGWGAQVLEQPVCGLIVFADLDLLPEETAVDFASTPLPPTERLGTIGLWCALHGESMLQAGMHHLEAQFEFDGMKDYLETTGLRMMTPFSDFPYLKQAFSKGETWPVRQDRLQSLLEAGKITQDEFNRYQAEGAIGSHLENLQRKEGYKGFNQKNVSNIIQATDPRNRL